MSGKVKFATREYYELLKEAVNKDPIITSSGYTSTWAYIFKDKITEAGVPLTYIIKWENGKIVEVREGKPDEKVEFKFIANYDVWVKTTKGEMSTTTAMMTGKYKIEGPTAKMMKYSSALSRLTDIVKSLNVEY